MTEQLTKNPIEHKTEITSVKAKAILTFMSVPIESPC